VQRDAIISIDSRKARRKARKKKELDYVNDDDVKRELRKGHTLLSYTVS
jgi:hypothetical protein